MKTAVSLPDALFKRAEAEAKKMSISRSEFYARAIDEFVRQRRDGEALAKLNEYYGENRAEIDPVLMEMQLRSLPKGRW